jgi:hypothetical protein
MTVAYTLRSEDGFISEGIFRIRLDHGDGEIVTMTEKKSSTSKSRRKIDHGTLDHGDLRLQDTRQRSESTGPVIARQAVTGGESVKAVQAQLGHRSAP